MTTIASTFKDGISANEAVTLVSKAHKQLSDTLHRPLKDQERTDVKQVSGALKDLLVHDGLPADEAQAAADRIVSSWHEAMIGAKDYADYTVRFKAHADGPGGTLAFSPQSLHFPDQAKRVAAPAPAAPAAPASAQAAATTGLVSGIAQAAETPTTVADVASRVKAVFARIDTSGDGELSEAELKAALSSPAFKGKDAAAVAVLLSKYGEVAKEHDDGEWYGRKITLADVDAMATSAKGDKYVGRFETYLGRMEETSAAAFPNGISDIKAKHVTQNELGDCYFMAAVSSLARRRPADIQQMITDNGNGTFTVTFPGQKPVTIASPTDGEVAMYGNSDGHGRWVSILEKAYAKHTHDHSWIPHGDHDQDSIGNGDVTWAGVNALSSKGSSTYVPGGDLPAVMKASILNGQNTGRMMVANTSPLTLKDEIVTKSGHKLPTGHVYEVVGFTDDSLTTVKIRNPWGTGGPNGDGIHELDIKEFLDHFQTISIED